MEEGYTREKDDGNRIKNITMVFLLVVVTVFFGVVLQYDIPSLLLVSIIEVVLGICCLGIQSEQKSS